ncbi:MAG: VCBS domain-containing protein [Halopseudomonas aestusnigri]
MTDGLTQGGNEMVSGEVTNESLVGQAASAVEVAAPAAGETTNVVLSKGQTATLNFDATAATPVIEGNDFVLTFDSNGDGSADSRIVFQNLVQESQGADAPVLVIGGVELSAGLLIGQAQALVDGQTLETAAGAGAGPQGGGNNIYEDDFGNLIDGLNAQGVIEGTLAELAALAAVTDGTDPAEGVFTFTFATTNVVSFIEGGVEGDFVGGFEDWQANQHLGDEDVTDNPDTPDVDEAISPMQIVFTFTPNDNEVVDSVDILSLPEGVTLYVGGFEDSNIVFSSVSGSEVGSLPLNILGSDIGDVYLQGADHSDADIPVTIQANISDPDSGETASLVFTSTAIIDAAADKADLGFSEKALGGEQSFEDVSFFSDDFSNLDNWSILKGSDTSSVNGGEDSQLDGSGIDGTAVAEFLGVTTDQLNAAADNGDAESENFENGNGSAVQSTITVQAGQTLTFDFNFLDGEVGDEALEFNDTAFIVINGEIHVLGQSASGSEDGVFTYTFEESGEVEIGIAVLNEGDTSVIPALILENLSLELEGVSLDEETLITIPVDATFPDFDDGSETHTIVLNNVPADWELTNYLDIATGPTADPENPGFVSYTFAVSDLVDDGNGNLSLPVIFDPKDWSSDRLDNGSENEEGSVSIEVKAIATETDLSGEELTELNNEAVTTDYFAVEIIEDVPVVENVTLVHDETAAIDAGTDDILPEVMPVGSYPIFINGLSELGDTVNFIGEGNWSFAQIDISYDLRTDGTTDNNPYTVDGADPEAVDAEDVLEDIKFAEYNGETSGLFTGGIDAPEEIFLHSDPTNPEGVYGITADGDLVFYVYIEGGLENGVNDGTISFVQFQSVNHPDGGDSHNEDLTSALNLEYIIVDDEGDASTATASIQIKDDGPVISSDNAKVVVDDDDVIGANGNASGVGDDAPAAVSGTLVHDYGRDVEGATTLLLDTGAPEGFSYEVSNDGTLLTVSQGDVEVMTVELQDSSSGGYTVTLISPISHPEGSDENNVDFTFDYRVTDGDDDTVDGTFDVSVDDDTPVVADEDAGLIKEKRLDDTDPNNSTVNGTLDIDFGADGGTVTGIEFKGWTDTEDKDPSGTTLTSGGVAVVFASTIVNGELVYTGSVGTAEIIKVVIDQETGEYSITQLGPIDHPDVSYDSENDGPTNSNDYDPITLSFDYTVTDGDGDTATAELSVVIEDDEVDSRSVFADDSIFIDEATLVDGVDDNSVISGTLELGLGADGGSVTNVWFDSWEDSEDGNPDGQTLTSGGNPVVFADAVEDGSGNWVLVGKVGTQEIVTVTIDKLTGEYSIELQGPIDNPDHGSANSNPWDPVTLSFRYETIDGDGDQDISTLEIIIEDDQSVAIADTNSGDAVKEDDDLIAEGNVLDNDTIGADGAVVTTTDEMTGTYGSVTIDADGEYTYNLNNGADNVQSLAQGETVTETFTYEIEDADGDTSTATLEISITGTNDAPVIGGLNGEYYGVNGQISNLAQFRSIVDGNDPDATFTASEISYSIGRGTVSRGDNLQKFLGDDADTLSSDPGNTSDGGLHMFGQVYLAAGTYQFQVRADDGFQIKIDGDSVSEYANNQGPTTRTGAEFTIAEDGYYDVDMVWWDQGGAYVFQPALSFNGGAFETFTPDNFDFQLDAGSTVVEAGNLDDGTVVDGTDTVTGSMVATDVDNGAVLTWSGDADGTYGSFSINPTTGAWEYTLDNSDADTDALAEGQNETETFTVTVTDEFGATDTQDVTITVKGTNDSPIAVADTDVPVAAGTELASDAAPAQLTNNSETSTSDFDFGPENAGKLVSIEFDFQSVGSWDENGGNQDDFIVTINGVEVLITHDGGSKHYTFEVATDSDGKVAIEFNAVVTGDDEGADITNLVISTVGDNWVETLTTDENASLTVDVLANDTDVDNGAVLSLDAVSFASAMTTATATVVGNELVFNPGTDFDYLAEGETAEVVVNYTISDENGAVSSSTATIVVTGSNDAPVLEALALLTNNAENFSFEGDLLARYSSDAEGDDVVISPANVDVASGDTDFAYTGSDGEDSTNGTVGVTRVDDLTVTGTDADEILIGRDVVSADEVDLSVDEDFSNVSEWTVLGNTTSVNSGQDTRLNTSDNTGSVVSAAVFAAAVGVSVNDLNVAADNGVDSGEDLTSGSALYRDFTVAAGQTLTLDFNFINQESGGTTWDDASVIVIGDEVFLLSQSSNIDADGIFTYTFTDSGPVTVGIAVFNETDTIADSSLIVENLSLSDAEIPAVLGDNLNGGGGDDTLMGLAGDDFLAGGAGDDVMIGGTGDDTFAFSLAGAAASGGEGSDVISDFDAANDVLHFSDVVDGGETGLDLNDLNAMVSSVDNNGDGNDVVVNFNNGASITFEGLGSSSSTIDTIDDLVNNAATQIIID